MPTLLTPFSPPASPNAPALILPASSPTPNLTLSYGQLTQLIDGVRKSLDTWDGRLNKGDVVSMSFINGVEFAACFLGVGAHRCVAAPLNPAYTSSEVSFYLEDTQSKLLLVPAGAIRAGAPAVKAAQALNVPIAEVGFDGKVVFVRFANGKAALGGNIQGSGTPQDDDIALVLHTSGTTGKPKGLLAGFLAPLLSGGSVVVPPKFSAGIFWEEFIGTKSNWYTIEEAFKAPVLEAYAMTEASHQMTSNPLPPLARKPGTVGIGQGVKIRILSLTSDEDVEEGEVAIQGPNVTPGYINNPKANKEAFTADGYFRTGDRGRLDSEGYLSLTGRLKELINKGGEKISPLEVDAALLSVEGVAEAVAFGVEDQKYGEKVWAAVVLKSKITEADILKVVRTKISAFKCPDKIFILDSIPKTATGKIQRKALATKFDKEVKESNKEVKAKL
ncbi:hypothetical protein RQP46_004743 [Phenoliferia psychrophenolica]